MSTSVLHHPHLAASPAGSSSTLWQRVWAALEQHGQRRAAAELRRVAALHVFSDPALTQHLHDAADRAERS